MGILLFTLFCILSSSVSRAQSFAINNDGSPAGTNTILEPKSTLKELQQHIRQQQKHIEKLKNNQ